MQKKPITINWLIALTVFAGLLSCTHKKLPQINHVVIQKLPAVVKNSHLFIEGDSLCIAIDHTNKVMHIPNDTTIDHNMPFNGLYEIVNDSLKRSYSKLVGHYLYFTTYEDLGMGYRGNLYVYDLKKKMLTVDQTFKRNYLYSSAGIFIIDGDIIYSIGKPQWYDRKNIMFTSGSMYLITLNRFKFAKILYEEGEKTYDNSIVDFYKKTLANKGKNGLILPKNWWKWE